MVVEGDVSEFGSDRIQQIREDLAVSLGLSVENIQIHVEAASVRILVKHVPVGEVPSTVSTFEEALNDKEGGFLSGNTYSVQEKPKVESSSVAALPPSPAPLYNITCKCEGSWKGENDARTRGRRDGSHMM